MSLSPPLPPIAFILTVKYKKEHDLALKAMDMYVSLGKTLYSIRSTFQREGIGGEGTGGGKGGGWGEWVSMVAR